MSRNSLIISPCCRARLRSGRSDLRSVYPFFSSSASPSCAASSSAPAPFTDFLSSIPAFRNAAAIFVSVSLASPTVMTDFPCFFHLMPPWKDAILFLKSASRMVPKAVAFCARALGTPAVMIWLLFLSRPSRRTSFIALSPARSAPFFFFAPPCENPRAIFRYFCRVSLLSQVPQSLCCHSATSCHATKKPPSRDGSGAFVLEQDTGIEPASSAWEADILPMY